MTRSPKELLTPLRRILREDQYLTDEAERWNYGYDNSRIQFLPDLVVFPENHDQVREVVSVCNQYDTPLVPRGRGTGTTGAVVPSKGGLILSTERLCGMGEVNRTNRYIVAEPGVTNQAVQQAAAAHGFFWPPDPTSAAFSSIGGNLAYNSAGPRAVKYGTPRENVLGLRAITGDGKDIRTGVFTTKGVVGYDLTRLLIGSEGTLAIITEATLKLTPLPECKRTFRLTYQDIHAATEAITDIMAQPEVPCALEFMDRRAIEMIRDYISFRLPDNAGAMLIVEADGSEESISHTVRKILAAGKNPGLIEQFNPETAQDIEALWQMRKSLSPALRKIAPKKINEDVVVPVSNIPALIQGLENLSESFKITIVNFGHAGNGNIHVNLLVDPDDPIQSTNAEKCLDAVFQLVLSLNGTLSGEHGVGLVKREFIGREIDRVTLDLMQKIKTQFDPNNILNPGKTI